MLTSSPGGNLSTALLASMCEFVQDSVLSLKVIIICVVSIVAEVESLRMRRILLHPWLCVIKADIIDAEALFSSGALLPMEILLRMTADLDWRPCGDKVPRYVLPATTTIHF